MKFSFGIYYRQLIFFSLLFGFVGLGFWYVNTTFGEAAPRPVIPTTDTAFIEITIQDGGKVLVNNQSVSGAFSFGQDSDRFFYQVFNRDGSLISSLTTKINWSRSVDPSQVTARHFSDIGTNLGEPQVTSNNATFQVFNLTPTSTYSVELVLSKNIIRPTFFHQVLSRLVNIPAAAWLSVSLILPSLAFIVLLFLIWRAQRSWNAIKSHDIISSPPDQIPPAIVGLLLRGKVTLRLLAATILDLARRGYVQIVQKTGGYSFGRRKLVDVATTTQSADQNLFNFEKIILEEIFAQQRIKSTPADIELQLGQHIFSRKIAESYIDIYDAAVKLGWFVRNPQTVYQHYRLLALLIMGISIMGFILSLIFAPTDNLSFLLGWAGLLFVGIVMYQIVPLMPHRTAQGDKAYVEWQKFSNYLSAPNPINAMSSSAAQELYYSYLPYAVAIGLEVEWSERFLHIPFREPEWFTSVKSLHVVEEVTTNLFPLIGLIAYNLAKAREPFAV